MKILAVFFLVSSAFANPYFDKSKVPQDSANQEKIQVRNLNKVITNSELNPKEILRVLVEWTEKGEVYTLTDTVLEKSGTEALLRRANQKPKWGSYFGILKSKASGKELYYDSVGTGREYRKLTRALSFRFPVPTETVLFEVIAENSTSGKMELVLTKELSPKEFRTLSNTYEGLETRLLSQSNDKKPLRFTIYADGYLASEKNKFFSDANKVLKGLSTSKFPQSDRFEVIATFAASKEKLGEADNLGLPVKPRDSFLGLYYPYWQGLDRWYNIVYPTQEKKFREGLATTSYDYPLVIMNSAEYWGIGNYMAFTAVPSDESSFVYLLWHELGHFFGLNEEYQGGGPTELEFAYDIEKPFSQNLVFSNEANHTDIKWKALVSSSTKLPTPDDAWKPSPPVYGAYEGGYADSVSKWGKGLKPGHSCVMDRAKLFCDVCKNAIKEVVDYFAN